MAAETPEARYILNISFLLLFFGDAYNGREFFSPLQFSSSRIVPDSRWTDGQQMRQRGQKLVTEQASKHEVRQASRIKEVLVPKMMKSPDKPIGAQFGGGTVA
jgi:hypothetical protein